MKAIIEIMKLKPVCTILTVKALARITPLVLSMSLLACAFTPPVPIPDGLIPGRAEDIPLAPIVESSEQTVYQDGGDLIVVHGFACAESNREDRQDSLRVVQSRPLPPLMNRATVFLNGWQFEYMNGDHEIMGLGTGIFDIQRDNNALSWQAYGIIGDQNFDDPYRWCYRYTLLAWRSAAYAVGTDHRDDYAFQGQEALLMESDLPSVDFTARSWKTALAFHPNYVSTLGTGYSELSSAAILPRGFGFIWSDFNDNNLLQLAYNLDYSEQFISDGRRYVGDRVFEVGGANAVDQAVNNIYTWETKTIFKDNDLQRDYRTGEIFSVLAGPGLDVLQPPFTIVPFEDRSNCVPAGGTTPAIQTRTVNHLPFDVAIPVLTGWDLSYPCNDQHVEEIGVFVEDFNYTRGSANTNGVMEYTVRSALKDENGGDGIVFRHRVGILGFNRRPPGQLIIIPDTVTLPILNDSRELSASVDGFVKQVEWYTSDPGVAELSYPRHLRRPEPPPGTPHNSKVIGVRCLNTGQATLTADPIDPALQNAAATVNCQ